MVSRKTNPRTYITEVQKAFEAELYRRLVSDPKDRHPHDPLKRGIRQRIEEDDWFDLTETTVDDLFTDGGSLAAQDGFEFPENPQRSVEFDEWLEDAIDRGVLVRVDRQRVLAGEHWTGTHMRAASRQGIRHGDRELRRAGIEVAEDSVAASLRTPVHQKILKSGYRRAYDKLDGITADMSSEISRVMSEGLGAGKHPSAIATDMNKRVDVGLTRSRRMSRTETAWNYNTHSLNRYSEYGVDRVELLTSDPCDLCADIASGGPYPVGDAPQIPSASHPNCVCSWSPLV